MPPPQAIKQVIFDRGAYLYQGRIKALADAAREDGTGNSDPRALRGRGETQYKDGDD